MRRLTSALLLLGLAACGDGGLPTSTTSDRPSLPGLQPVSYYVADTVAGNPICTELGYDFGFKVDRGGSTNVNGTWQVGDVGTVTFSGNGTTFTWSSTFGVDAVVAKGGREGAIVYRYDPESTGDTGLTPPVNPSGQPAAISHLDVCFDLNLDVSKTAATTYTRTYDWTIDKSASVSSLLLEDGQVSPAVNYTVAVDNTFTDSDWAANGVITIKNPAPFAATVTELSDVVSPDLVPELSCPAVPFQVAAGATVSCTYALALPDAQTRENVVTVVTDPTVVGTVNTEADGLKFYGGGAVEGGSGKAAVAFGEPTLVVDESVSLTDSRQGLLGTATGPRTWTYSRTYGPYAVCGEYDEGNLAVFTTNDRAYTGSDGWNVHVTVTGCESTRGCTLTQGYWKTHSQLGPAPYDAEWLELGVLQQNTMFYNSGKTWYQVFWTAPAGNVYYNLAHQFMAAKLNVLAGASTTPAVDAALAQANTLFAGITGTTVPSNKRATFLALAATLDAYNTGRTGPGHCSE